MPMAFVWLGIVLAAGALTYRFESRSGVRTRSRPAIDSAAARAVFIVAESWLRRSGVFPKLAIHLPQLLRYCAMIADRHDGPDPAYVWTVKTFALTAAAAIAAGFAYLAEADPAVALLFALFAVVAPVLLWQELKKKVADRQRAFVSELPTFLHKLSLLLAAGETVQRAWQRAGVAGPDKAKHPLYAELARTNTSIEQGVPFPKALEDMHRRSGFHEVGALVTTVLMNYKRGGEAFALALQDASRLMMEKKHAVVRMQGEEASTKLLFPMLLMLIAVMLIVAAPAVMLMN
jgi:tight adherence protein C